MHSQRSKGIGVFVNKEKKVLVWSENDVSKGTLLICMIYLVRILLVEVETWPWLR